MATYTAGPWKVEPLEKYRHGYSGWNTFTVRNSKTNICISVVGEVDRSTSPENEANAKLMAASPDLLQACEIILEAWDKKYISEADAEIVRRAVSKAKE